MDPVDFEAIYHFIPFVDLRMGLIGMGNVTRYMAGFPDPKAPPKKGAIDNLAEYGRVMRALAKRLGLKGTGMVPKKFSFVDDPRVDPNEEFYQMTIRRTYEGRASPSEMGDTVRICFLLGLINYPVDASAYAAKYFAQDCNSFVGNYLGISPYVSIAAYVHGYPGHGAIPGATTDIYTCRELLPLPPVKDIDSIQKGTVLVTYGDADSRGNRWRHIALVQDFEPVMGVGGARSSGKVTIVEWGTAGDSAKHYVPPTLVKLVDYKCPELPGRKLLAYHSTSTMYGKNAMRIFLDGSKFKSFPRRGWHVCNAQGALVYDG